MDKFQHKYRISSARLQNWDYGWNASWFVTICTENRECFFGDVDDGDMVFSEIGEIAEKCWLEIPEHFPFVKLDVHVVMPNHVHGIKQGLQYVHGITTLILHGNPVFTTTSSVMNGHTGE
jgi:putative transposase